MRWIIVGLAILLVTKPPTLHARSSISDDAQILVELYQELHQFKDTPEFHQVGFGACCKYHDWLERVDALTGRTGISIAAEVGFLPGDLRNLSMAYMQQNQGKKNQVASQIEAMIGASPVLQD